MSEQEHQNTFKQVPVPVEDAAVDHVYAYSAGDTDRLLPCLALSYAAVLPMQALSVFSPSRLFHAI